MIFNLNIFFNKISFINCLVFVNSLFYAIRFNFVCRSSVIPNFQSSPNQYNSFYKRKKIMTDVKEFLYGWSGRRKIIPNYEVKNIGNKHKQRFLCEVGQFKSVSLTFVAETLKLSSN